ncbi:hypothetical protein [Nocardioides daphniae]|uniref:hypothetical protein n=1 Tax=Nocardioides daphniae TaxID=402297 RepID=UPI0019310323|nr:hypothetical protein [Nocardioides daphniae]
MTAALLSLAAYAVEVQAESGTPWILLAAGPVGAVAVYWGLFRYYRNTDKSHSFERETLIESQPIVGHETKFDTVRGTERREVSGNNVSKHRQRVRRLD